MKITKEYIKEILLSEKPNIIDTRLNEKDDCVRFLLELEDKTLVRGQFHAINKGKDLIVDFVEKCL